MNLNDFTQISPYRWVMEKNTDKSNSMNTNAEVFGTEHIIKAAIEDQAVQQVFNVSTLPGIVSNSYAMPGIPHGHELSIGDEAPFRAATGIALPGGVGYGINCGVRLLATNIPASELQKHSYKESIGYNLLSKIPTGTTDKGKIKLDKKEFIKVLENGAEEIVEKYAKYSSRNDLRFIESSGKLDFDMPGIISERAMERGRSQVGSLGGGNHFLEVQVIDEIYDEKAAAAFGLKKGNISIMIHTGSRGFGHQIATDFIETIRKKNISRIKIKDPQLIYAEIRSPEGQHYLQALNAASNFAWANRHLLMDTIIEIFEVIFKLSSREMGMRLVYDQAHNIAKFENHLIDGKNQRVLVHRKGATRAFPPGHKEIPEEYRLVGQPVLLPGSMGTASYVLKGTQKAMEISLGSSAHGAGRQLSRHKALQLTSNMDVKDRLKKKDILVFSFSGKGLREEVPEAYKEIDEIVEVTEGAGISDKVARMIPLVVVKG